VAVAATAVVALAMALAVAAVPAVGRPAAAGAAPPARDQTCRRCHEDEDESFRGTIHEARGVGCVDCHGGDGSDPREKESMDARKDFVWKMGKDKRKIFAACARCHSQPVRDGVPAPAAAYRASFHGRKVFEEGDFSAAVCTDCHRSHDILPVADPRSPAHRLNVPGTCDRCHGDDARMNPYGIPTDQYKKYRISHHGRAVLERRNSLAAVCTDCHTAHSVLPPQEPASPIHPANVPATCARCHEDAALMSKHGLPATAPRDYRAGVHGVALLARGATAAPSCASCHGNHTAVPPGHRSVAMVCGKCHPRSEEAFTASVHATVAAFKGCVECHGNHDIRHPTPRLFDTACVRCHATGTPAFARGQELERLLVGAISTTEATAARVEALRASGYALDKLRNGVGEARRALIAMGPSLHTLSVTTTHAGVEKIAAINAETLAGVADTERKTRWRRASLLIVTLTFLSVAWLFRELSRCYAREEDEQDEEDGTAGTGDESAPR
jgi:hypothetical protein